MHGLLGSRFYSLLLHDTRECSSQLAWLNDQGIQLFAQLLQRRRDVLPILRQRAVPCLELQPACKEYASASASIR